MFLLQMSGIAALWAINESKENNYLYRFKDDRQMMFRILRGSQHRHVQDVRQTFRLIHVNIIYTYR